MTPTAAKSPPSDPPENLTEPARTIWCATLTALPTGWIPAETLPILERYCRHVARAAQFEALIAAAEPGSGAWRALVDGSRRESATVGALARALRLTVQSRLRAESAYTRAAAHARAARVIDAAQAGAIAEAEKWAELTVRPPAPQRPVFEKKGK